MAEAPAAVVEPGEQLLAGVQCQAQGTLAGARVAGRRRPRLTSPGHAPAGRACDAPDGIVGGPYYGLAMPRKIRDLIRLVEDDGWFLVGQTGSHRQYKHATKPGRVTIAGKPSVEVPPKTEKSILRQAGLEGGRHER